MALLRITWTQTSFDQDFTIETESQINSDAVSLSTWCPNNYQYRQRLDSWSSRAAYDEMLKYGFHSILRKLNSYYKVQTGFQFTDD